jgi:hypothetical protein
VPKHEGLRPPSVPGAEDQGYRTKCKVIAFPQRLATAS